MSDIEGPSDNLTGEPVDEAILIADLMARGLENPDVKALLEAWTLQQEAIAEDGGDEVRVAFEIKRASLYSQAGMAEYAEIVWDDAQYLAEATGNERLIKAVDDARKTQGY